jgi:hypothetical protein
MPTLQTHHYKVSQATPQLPTYEDATCDTLVLVKQAISTHDAPTS